jgi:hypothetical protein
MSDKVTPAQMDVIRLIQRSNDQGDGWRKCSPILFNQLIAGMPDELVEKDSENLRCRLADAGKVLAQWA